MKIEELYPAPDLTRSDLVKMLAVRRPGEAVSLRGLRLCGLDLHALDFSDADLSKADLRGCNLGECRFHRATLAAADLSHATAAGADFKSARLTEANLSGLNAPAAYFSGANLNGADLSGAKIDADKMDGATLDRAYRLANGLQLASDAVSMKVTSPARRDYERTMTTLAVAERDKAMGGVADKLLGGNRQRAAEKYVADDARREADQLARWHKMHPHAQSEPSAGRTANTGGSPPARR